MQVSVYVQEKETGHPDSGGGELRPSGAPEEKRMPKRWEGLPQLFLLHLLSHKQPLAFGMSYSVCWAFLAIGS